MIIVCWVDTKNSCFVCNECKDAFIKDNPEEVNQDEIVPVYDFENHEARIFCDICQEIIDL